MPRHRSHSIDFKLSIGTGSGPQIGAQKGLSRDAALVGCSDLTMPTSGISQIHSEQMQSRPVGGRCGRSTDERTPATAANVRRADATGPHGRTCRADGAGKTSMGKRLASLLGVAFVDSDDEIAKAAGMSIPEIFTSSGERAFRDEEHRVIMRLLDGQTKIIDTGGGGFLEPRNRSEILRQATSVWLRADLDLLWDRVPSRPGRPLPQVSDPRATLADLHQRRSALYAEADITVDSRRDAGTLVMAHRILSAMHVHAQDFLERGAVVEYRRARPHA
jgi:shikimate kinase